MKELFYSLILLSVLTYSVPSNAQEMTRHPRQLPNEEIKDRISKFYRFQDAYLFTLTDEQRKELFYYKRKGEKVTHKMRETDVKHDEERFQRIIEKYDNMTDTQRDSILTAHIIEARTKGKTAEVQKILVDENIFEEVPVRKEDRQDILNIFKGQPVYIITTKRPLPNGEVIVSDKQVLYYKNLYPIFGAGFLRGD